MGDEEGRFASGGYMFMAGDDGEWQSLGHVAEGGISFVSDSDEEELELWQGRLADMSQTMTIALKPQWWSLNRLYELLLGRPKCTVPMLRKGKKGHRGCRR